MSIFGDAWDDLKDAGSNLMGGAGTQNRTQIVNPNSSLDPNAFNYGGTTGGAQARENQLSQMGAAGANYSGTQPYQAAQMSALAQAQREANGEDFGATQAQLNQGLAQAQAGAASQAASARGGGANLAAAQNQAANIQGGQAASANNAAAGLKAQLQMQGVNNLNNFASGGLGQQAQMAQFNAQNQLGFEGLGNQIGLGQLQAQQNQQQLQSQNTLASQGQASQQAAGNASTNAGLLGGLVGGAGGAVAGLASKSDVRAKGSIQGESGGRYMSSPVEAKNGIEGESSWMPGMSAGSQAIGQAELAASPTTSNLHLKGSNNIGMNAWIDQAMAKPWSPQAAAADANVHRVFFTSDEGQKTDIGSESKEGNADAGHSIAGAAEGFTSGMGKSPAAPHDDYNPKPAQLVGQHTIWRDVTSDTRAKKKAVEESALAKAAAQMQADIGGKTNGFEWMRDQPTAVELAKQPSAADEFMETARPYTYDYKNPAENGGNRRLGIMAQDLERGPTGPDLVKDTPRGKVVDVPALASANTAAVGRLHDRVSALEAMASPDDGARSMPAGEVIRDPKLAPEEHGIFSVYDNGTRLVSDATAKKDARDEGFAKGVAAATQMAPRQDVQQISHASSNPETDAAWRRAILAQQSHVDLPPPPKPTSTTDLPAPPDPRFIDPEETQRQMDAHLAAWNQGAAPRSALIASQHPTPASFQPVVVASRAPSGGVFATPPMRMR